MVITLLHEELLTFLHTEEDDPRREEGRYFTSFAYHRRTSNIRMDFVTAIPDVSAFSVGIHQFGSFIGEIKIFVWI